MIRKLEKFITSKNYFSNLFALLTHDNLQKCLV